MKTMLEFRSDAFPAEPGEEEEVNPGRYGRALARFIAEGLRGKGFETAEPVAEDWGWQIDVANDGFALWIGCGNVDEGPGAFLVFIQPSKPVVRPGVRKITNGRAAAGAPARRRPRRPRVVPKVGSRAGGASRSPPCSTPCWRKAARSPASN